MERGEGRGKLKEALRKELADAFDRDFAEYVKAVSDQIETDKIKNRQEQERNKQLHETYSSANIQKEYVQQVVIPVVVAAIVSFATGEIFGILGEGGAGGLRPTGGPRPLPALDRTGKLHGPLPKVSEFGRYSPDELRHLQTELKQSVQERIRKTVDLGSDKGHGLRQADEQELLQQIEKYLEFLQ